MTVEAGSVRSGEGLGLRTCEEAKPAGPVRHVPASLREEVPAMRLFSGLAVKDGARRTVVPELALEGDVSCLPPTLGSGGRWNPQQRWERSLLLNGSAGA